jgi:hypothetical protein
MNIDIWGSSQMENRSDLEHALYNLFANNVLRRGFLFSQVRWSLDSLQFGLIRQCVNWGPARKGLGDGTLSPT